jgi:hypothetical protein
VATEPLTSLMEAFSQVADPRDPRGVRHPFTGLLALVFLALLSRVSEFAAIRRWALRHWDVLREPLGFDREQPPCDTTLERAMARFSLAEFQAAFSGWLQGVLSGQTQLVAAVDGKTTKQGHDASGHPVAMLNVFAQDLKLALGSWPLAGDKTTEPEVLKAHLAELFDKHPALSLLTGDALYCQRNLAEIIVESNHDYLFQLKANQPDMLEAARNCFATADQRTPHAEVRKKRGAPPTRVVFGSTWITPDGSEIAWALPVAECSFASNDDGETVAEMLAKRRATSSPVSRQSEPHPSNC